MSYSQALEEQIRLQESVQHGFSGRAMRIMEASVIDGYGDRIFTGEVRVEDLPRSRWEYETEVHLIYATPYFWSRSVCGLIREVAASMPPWRLTPEALPSEAGFFWLDESLVFPMGQGRADELLLKALVWGPSRKPDGAGQQRVLAGSVGDGVAITTWTCERGTPSHLIPCHYVDWWFGETPAEATGRFSPETIESKYQAFSTVAAMLAFLEQRILVAPAQLAERPARRRLTRQGFLHEPLIRVVELRRKQGRSEQHGDSESVDWSHQWLVSGHWRQQWYPSLHANQPRWIMPYVKGPEDKPLKPPRAKLFAVVR